MNLAVGRYLTYLLNANPNFAGSQATRDADIALCCGERTTFADAMHADLFVSIHHNGISNDDNLPDPASPAQLYTLVEYDRTQGYQTFYGSQSFALADCIANGLCATFSPGHALSCPDPVKEDMVQSGIHLCVLTGNNRPAALGEACGVWSGAAAEICRPDLFPTAFEEAQGYFNGIWGCYGGIGAVGNSFQAYPFRAGSMRLTWTESDPSRNVTYYLQQADNCWGPFYYAGIAHSHDIHTSDGIHYRYDVATDYARMYWYQLSVTSETVYSYATAIGGGPFVPPAKPTNLAAVGTDQGGGWSSVALTWQESGAQPDVYWIYRSLGIGMQGCTDDFELVGSSSGPSFTDGTAPTGLRLYYRVRAFNATGGSPISDQVSVSVTATVSVASGSRKATELMSCRPNPSRGVVYMDYQVADGGVLSVRIYDVAGRLIAEPFHGYRAAGEYHLSWDGGGRQQGKLPGSVYFLRLSMDGVPVGQKRLVLLR